MRSVERRLLAIHDAISVATVELALTLDELTIHRHLDDDARRDAVVGGPIEREDARITEADVARFEELAARLQRKIARLEEKRSRLLARLD
jgi:hypothetical protein